MVIWIYLRVFAIPISGCLYLLQDCEHFQLLFYYVDFLCLFSSLLLLALPKFKHLFTCWCPMYHLYTLLFFSFSFFLYYFKRPIFKNRNYYFCVIWSIVESLSIIFIPFIEFFGSRILSLFFFMISMFVLNFSVFLIFLYCPFVFSYILPCFLKNTILNSCQEFYRFSLGLNL